MNKTFVLLFRFLKHYVTVLFERCDDSIASRQFTLKIRLHKQECVFIQGFRDRYIISNEFTQALAVYVAEETTVYLGISGDACGCDLQTPLPSVGQNPTFGHLNFSNSLICGNSACKSFHSALNSCRYFKRKI